MIENFTKCIQEVEADRQKIRPKILNMQTTEFLNMMYSSPPDLPLPSSSSTNSDCILERPPTPSKAIENGSAFLEREHKKGFLEKFDPIEFKKTLLRPSLIAKASIANKQQLNSLMNETQSMSSFDQMNIIGGVPSNKPQNFDLEKLFEAEKFQKFWLTSETVEKISNEIKKLPFVSNEDSSVVVNRFLEGVASVVRIMKHKKMLDDEDRQKKKQLRETMLHFITETNESRIRAISFAIRAQLLDISKLSDKYVTEFADVIPKEETAKYKEMQQIQQMQQQNEMYRIASSAMEEKMMEHISSNCEKVPVAYRLKNFQLNEDQCSKTKREYKKMMIQLPNIILNEMAKTTRPEAVISEKSADEMMKDFEMGNNNINSNGNGKKLNRETVNQTARTKTTTKLITIPFKNIEKKRKPFFMNEIKEIPIMTAQEIHEKYWENDDPLTTFRGGDEKEQPLRQMNEVSSTFQAKLPSIEGVEIKLPFQLTVIPGEDDDATAQKCRNRRGRGPNLIKNVWMTSELNGKNHSQNENGNETEYEYEYEEEEEEEEANETNDNDLINEMGKNNSNNSFTNENNKNAKIDDNNNNNNNNNVDNVAMDVNSNNGNVSVMNTRRRVKRKKNAGKSDETTFSTTNKGFDAYNLNGDPTKHGATMPVTLEAVKRSNDAMVFLKSYELSQSSKESDAIVEKLQTIWERLGFSIQQKLSILLKYTKTTEESQKLQEALHFWEMTFDVVMRYESAYQAMKEFVKYEAATASHAYSTCLYLRNEVENHEKSVYQIAENLMNSFGDELIIKRRAVGVILPQRHRKMVSTMAPYFKE